jgi:thiol-disulfide isomerase/thioredoxin
MVLVDAYTDWCGWCKLMDREVFSREDVGKLMNERFVSVKLEMEKEEIGQKLARKFSVSAFPSYLIFTSDGVLHAQLIGYREAEEWLDVLHETLNEETPPRPAISVGLTDRTYPEFYSAVFGLPEKPDDWGAVQNAAAEYFLTLDPLDEVGFMVASRFTSAVNDSVGNAIIDRADDLREGFGEDLANGFLGDLFYYQAQKASEAEDEEAVKRLMERHKEVLPDERLARRQLLIQYYESLKLYDKMTAEINQIVNELSPGAINSVAWDLYLNCDEPRSLHRAVEWMHWAIEREENYEYIDTYAALLYKTDQLEKAREQAERAISMAQAHDINYEGTEELLGKIHEALGRVNHSGE